MAYSDEAHGAQAQLPMRGVIFNKVPGLLLRYCFNVTHLVSKFDAIEFICFFQQLGSERGGYELSSTAQFMNHVCQNKEQISAPT